MFPQIEWIINNGASTAFGTGPSVDHTFGTPLGRYIYFRGDGITQRLYGALRSHQFEAMSDEDSLCFEFWYHMNGDSVPELAVAIDTGLNGDGDKLREIWLLSKSEGDVWRQALVPIKSSEAFTVLIYAAASSNQLRLEILAVY